MRFSELASWYTPAQAAHKIGISRQYATRLAEDGRMRAVLVGRDNPGGRGFWALDPASVEAFTAQYEREER